MKARAAHALVRDGAVHELTADADPGHAPVGPVRGWLHEPDPSLIRSGLMSLVAADLVGVAREADVESGDLVVHVEHGIGRYIGLTSIPVGSAPHDCVALEYAGGDKLYVPVGSLSPRSARTPTRPRTSASSTCRAPTASRP